MATFEDHFSASATDYARFRPRYPERLFTFLAHLAPATDLVWDCGTGNGQAAAELAVHFDRVVATDASAEQLALAPRHPRIEYRNEPAERVGLADASVDLVAVAAAVHWFDLDLFYPEVRRVLKPGGAVAFWAYHLPSVCPEVDRLIEHYSETVLAPDWPVRSRYVREGYRSLPFPFHEVDAPRLEVEVAWSLFELIGFIGSWSAAVAHLRRTGEDPVAPIREGLEEAWGAPDRIRRVVCPLYLRTGRIDRPR